MRGQRETCDGPVAGVPVCTVYCTVEQGGNVSLHGDSGSVLDSSWNDTVRECHAKPKQMYRDSDAAP